MNKHYNSQFDETYYTETLTNGLKVIIFNKPKYKNSICLFGTPYGALKINQKVNNKHYSFNAGIAHFIEHKLFEEKGDDMMNAFSSMGARVNAFTSYNETVYYFSTTSANIDKPLNLLLDFVQELNISDQSVQKEKGIIGQEVSMYMQMPDQRLLNETYKSLYHHYPLKYDVGGDLKSINKITKNELEECYNINYHPSNMVLCIASPIDPKKLIKIVRDNQNKKVFKKYYKPLVDNKKEPDEVVFKKHSIKMDIAENKHICAYKIKPNFIDEYDALIKEWALRIYLEIYFSPINPDYQKWLDKKMINDFFGYEIDFSMDYANILFYIENKDSKVLANIIDDALSKNLLNKDVLKQIKNRYIGSMYSIFDDVEEFASGYIRDLLNGYDYFKVVEAIKKIKLSDVEKAAKLLNCPHKSTVSIIKKK